MLRLLTVGCVGLIILGSALNGNAAGEAQTGPALLSIRPTVTAGADGLLVDRRIPETQIMARGDGTSEVALPGASQTVWPGAPVLPFLAELVAVPPAATATLHVILVEESDRPLPGRLVLAPLPAGVQRDASGLPIGGDLSAISPGQPYQSRQGSRKDEPVVLESAGIVRGVHLARLVFYPARPVGNYPQAHIRLTTHVRISLTFAGQADDQLRPPSPDPLVATLRAAVINPEQVQPSQVTGPNPPAEIRSEVRNSDDAGSAWALDVKTPGLTAITYEALAGSGFPVASSNPHLLHLHAPEARSPLNGMATRITPSIQVNACFSTPNLASAAGQPPTPTSSGRMIPPASVCRTVRPAQSINLGRGNRLDRGNG